MFYTYKKHFNTCILYIPCTSTGSLYNTERIAVNENKTAILTQFFSQTKLVWTFVSYLIQLANIMTVMIETH